MEHVKGSAMELCFEAARFCEKTYAEVLDKNDPELIRYLRDCVTVCYTCGELCARDSALLGAVSKACADVCTACAEVCEKRDIKIAQECADACRRCADACRKAS